MSYYFIANIQIHDPEEYQRYIKNAGQVFNKFRGEYLVVDNNPEVLEGAWNYTRAVLIRFNTKSDFEDWYNSTEYKQILKHRLQAAECDTILVEGLDKGV